MSGVVEATRERLERSLADLEWAVGQVPERVYRHEPRGAWSAARLLAHLVVYEEVIAAPLLEALVAGRAAATAAAGETSASLQTAELHACDQQPVALLARLRAARQRQIDALTAFSEAAAVAPVATAWGQKSPVWVLNKTFEHTWEHGTSILQIALWGEELLAIPQDETRL